MFLMLFCSNSAHFSENQLVCDGRTDRHFSLFSTMNAAYECESPLRGGDLGQYCP